MKLFDDVEVPAMVRLDELAGLVRQREKLDAEIVAAVSAVNEVSGWKAAGLFAAIPWLTSNTHMSESTANELMRIAKLCRRNAATAMALASGSLSFEHARVLARAVTWPRQPFYPESEALLLDQATKFPLIKKYQSIVAHWCRLVDQERDLRPDEEPQRVSLWHRLNGGSRISGELDAATTALVAAALDACDSGPDPVDSPTGQRSLAQRRADALGDLAHRFLNDIAGWDPDDDADDDIDADDEIDTDDVTPEAADDGWGCLRRNRRPRRRGRRRAGGPLASLTFHIDVATFGHQRSQLELDGIVSRSNRLGDVPVGLIEMMLCNSTLAAVVTNGETEVLALNKVTALFNAAQRRAIACRDAHCVFPGCDRPPAWCDAHHLDPRSNGGASTIENGALLCRRHHRLVHAGWSIRRHEGRWIAIDPNGRTHTGRPA